LASVCGPVDGRDMVDHGTEEPSTRSSRQVADPKRRCAVANWRASCTSDGRPGLRISTTGVAVFLTRAGGQPGVGRARPGSSVGRTDYVTATIQPGRNATASTSQTAARPAHLPAAPAL